MTTNGAPFAKDRSKNSSSFFASDLLAYRDNLCQCTCGQISTLEIELKSRDKGTS